MNVQAAAVAETEPDDVLSSPEDLVLNGRYRFVLGAPLPTYGTGATQAFRVEDEHQGPLDLFALVGDQTLPPRSDEIAALTGFEHRHVMKLVDSGTVPYSGPGSAHQTIILEFPAGGHVMPPQGASAMAENDVKRRIMGPVLDALAALHEMSIVHRGVICSMPTNSAARWFWATVSRAFPASVSRPPSSLWSALVPRHWDAAGAGARLMFMPSAQRSWHC